MFAFFYCKLEDLFLLQIADLTFPTDLELIAVFTIFIQNYFVVGVDVNLADCASEGQIFIGQTFPLTLMLGKLITSLSLLFFCDYLLELFASEIIGCPD